MSETKKCCRCHNTKLVTEFYTTRAGKIFGHCKACNTVMKGEQRRANPEKNRAAVKRWRMANPEKAREIQARWKEANPERVRLWGQKRTARQYGLSLVDRADLLRLQSCRCAICSDQLKPGQHTAIDHDHETGKVRGILCSPCNTAIGLFKEDGSRMREAIAYLERHKKG